MKSYKLFSYSVDINLQCPSCRLFIKLRNGQIPTKNSIVIQCDGCKEHLEVPPVEVDVGYKTNKKPKSKPTNPKIQQAISTMCQTGYTKKEASKYVHGGLSMKKLTSNSSLEEIVKAALEYAAQDI